MTGNGNRIVVPVKSLTRVLALLACAHGVDRRALGEALLANRDALIRRFGHEANILIGTPLEEDNFSKTPGGSRRIESVDAILQVSYSGAPPMAEIIERARGLAADLHSAVDPHRSALAIGRVEVIVNRSEDIFFVFLGRRHPAVTLEQMRHWWLREHSVMDLDLVQPSAPHGYEQFHVEPHDSEKISEIAGFTYAEYDMGDAIFPVSMDRFIATISDPEVLRITTDDEERFLDPSSWRGAFMRTLK